MPTRGQLCVESGAHATGQNIVNQWQGQKAADRAGQKRPADDETAMQRQVGELLGIVRNHGLSVNLGHVASHGASFLAVGEALRPPSRARSSSTVRWRTCKVSASGITMSATLPT